MDLVSDFCRHQVNLRGIYESKPIARSTAQLKTSQQTIDLKSLSLGSLGAGYSIVAEVIF